MHNASSVLGAYNIEDNQVCAPPSFTRRTRPMRLAVWFVHVLASLSFVSHAVYVGTVLEWSEEWARLRVFENLGAAFLYIVVGVCLCRMAADAYEDPSLLKMLTIAVKLVEQKEIEMEEEDQLEHTREDKYTGRIPSGRISRKEV